MAGKYSGKVKALYDERGNQINEAPPSTPVAVLGLDGAPQAGDKFNVFSDEKKQKQLHQNELSWSENKASGLKNS